MVVIMVVLGCALVSRSSQTDPSQRREISLPPPSFLSFTISNLDELHFGNIYTMDEVVISYRAAFALF